MRKSKFTEHQIVSILKQHEAGVKVADVAELVSKLKNEAGVL